MTAQYNMVEGPRVENQVTFKVTLGNQDVTAAVVALMNADQVLQSEKDEYTTKFAVKDGYGMVENDGDSPFGLGDIAGYLTGVMRLPLAYEADEIDIALDGGVL
jgi:hypothetical protein